MAAIKLIFLDIPAGVAVQESFNASATFHDLTKMLSRMSGSVCDKIKGLERRDRLTEKGLNVNDGCWWYRVIKLTSAQAQQADPMLSQHTKGDWTRLASNLAYEYMRNNQLSAGLKPEEGWVEVQHDLQKKRDELTAVKARDSDKNWRSSIGHMQTNQQDDNASFRLINASPSCVDTSRTTPHTPNRETALEQHENLTEDTRRASIGSGTSAEQAEQLPEEGKSQDSPLVIEWPRPPCCTLIHRDENEVAQDAESRNHHPQPVAKFTKGAVHITGLPSYTPRPGPFPAQIGTPPSAAYCTYEIRNDIEYQPRMPTLEDIRTTGQAMPQSNLFGDRYYDGQPLPAQAPFNMEPLQTSISLPDQEMQYDPRNNLFEQPSYSMQSAPAHMQSFPPSMWGRSTEPGQSESRALSQVQYNTQSFGNAPYQGSANFGTGLDDVSRPSSSNEYRSQSMLRPSSNPGIQHQLSMQSPTPFVNPADLHYQSDQPQPQEKAPSTIPPGLSNFYNGRYGLRSFPDDHFGVNTNAMKESEIMAMQAQPHQYEASAHLHHQQIPSQYQRSSSIAQQPFSYQHRPGVAFGRSIRSHRPGFSADSYGTEAPTFATADNFSESFEMIAHGHDSSVVSNALGGLGDPASEANHQIFDRVARRLDPDLFSTASGQLGDPALEENHRYRKRQTLMQQADRYPIPPSPSTGRRHD